MLEFVRMADIILQILREPDFPKRRREAQINFLADSLGAVMARLAPSSRNHKLAYTDFVARNSFYLHSPFCSKYYAAWAGR